MLNISPFSGSGSFRREARRFRIVLDCANGAAFKLGPELFGRSALSYRHGVSPDGRNINGRLRFAAPRGLQKRVVAEKRVSACLLMVTPTARCSPAKREKS